MKSILTAALLLISSSAFAQDSSAVDLNLSSDCDPRYRPIVTTNEHGQRITLRTNTDTGWCAWSPSGIDNPVWRVESDSGNGGSSGDGGASGGSSGGSAE